MTHLDVLGQYGVRLCLIIVLSTWISLAVSALVLRALMRGDDHG
jgi:holin-like protein